MRLFSWISVILSLSEIIIGKLNKYSFLYFSIFSINIKKENGKLTIKSGSFKVGSDCGMLGNDRVTNRNKKFFEILTIAMPIILTIIFGIILFEKALLDMLILKWMLIHFMIFSSISLFMLIRTFKLLFSNKPEAIFVREVKNKFDLLKQGTPPRNLIFENINIPSKSSMRMYIKRYELFKFYHLIDVGISNELSSTIDNIEKYLPQEFMISHIPYYYEIIFYYSAIDKNIEKAKNFYNRVSKDLIDDKDVNGRRVYASYKYFIENNVNEAREIALQGLKMVNKFDIKGLAIYEERLLIELIRCIDNYKTNIRVELIY